MRNELGRFLESLREMEVPPGQAPLLESVWWGLKGDWHRAHEIAQQLSGADAAWIHAWLHRIEGDLANARYWYRCAQRDIQAGDTRAEGEAIAAELLARSPRNA